MAEPVWIEQQALLVLHSRSLALHGGAEGLRDIGLLESALHRAPNQFHYQGVTDIAALAASYAFGILRNPFVDGNKRAAFQSLTLFLRLNGLRLKADRVDATRTILAAAASQLDERDLIAWVKANSQAA